MKNIIRICKEDINKCLCNECLTYQCSELIKDAKEDPYKQGSFELVTDLDSVKIQNNPESFNELDIW